MLLIHLWIETGWDPMNTHRAFIHLSGPLSTFSLFSSPSLSDSLSHKLKINPHPYPKKAGSNLPISSPSHSFLHSSTHHSVCFHPFTHQTLLQQICPFSSSSSPLWLLKEITFDGGRTHHILPRASHGGRDGPCCLS